MNEQQITERLYELVSQYDYADLPEHLEQWVQRHSNEQDYRDLRKTYLGIESAEQPGEMDTPAVSQEMRAALASRKVPPSTMHWIRYPVPLWQAAAMLIIAVGVFLLIGRNAQPPDQVIVQMADTLNAQPPRFAASWQNDTLYLKELPSSTPATRDISGYAQNSSGDGNLPIFSLEQKNEMQKYGKSLAEDTLFEKFTVVSL